MRILWITNILLPEATAMLSGEKEIKGSGGWLVGASEVLAENRNIELFVASVTNLIKDIKRVEGKCVTHYALPLCGGNTRVNHKYDDFWKKIKNEINPDIVHIHGTEFSHALSYLNACGSHNVVVSVQGLTSVISNYYLGGLSKRDVLLNISFRDILCGSLLHDVKKFRERGLYEVEILSKVQHIIGRTRWDKSHTWAINPQAIYHFCNETLRTEFYESYTWDYKTCNKHSIFLSQAIYPLKGLHLLLRAMPLVLREYPDANIRIAGADITRNYSLVEKIKLSGYGKILRKTIEKYGLTNRIHFTGNLSASQMREEYLNCNVFVCPSSIENSPNSLGEAQMLGTPIIASYAGGIPDMMRGAESYLYSYDDVEELASLICDVFRLGERQIDMRQVASRRHSPEVNCTRLIEIYKAILSNGNIISH